MIIDTIQNYIPEIVIGFSIILEVILSFSKEKLTYTISNAIAFIGLVCATYSLIDATVLPSELYMSLLKILICFDSKGIFKARSTTFNIFLLSAILFSMLIISSNDFLSLYVNIELLSIATYFLLAFDRKATTVKESLKYLVTNLVASALYLIGVAFIYGLSGSIDFNGISSRINNIHSDYTISTYIIPYTFIISGLAFKLGVFPLANWMIDVFKRVNVKVLAYNSTIPKIAIFGAFIKVLSPVSWFEIALIMSILGLVTAFWGGFYGIKENNIKALMGCSSYINMSFIFIAAGFYTKLTIANVLFYLVAYTITNLGAWAGISVLENSNYHDENFNFQGYFYNNQFFTINFSVCIIALLGFPVTSGFIAKIYTISGILNSGILAIPVLFFLIFSMIIGVVFYLNILRKMFRNNPVTRNEVIETSVKNNKIILYLSSAFTIIIGLAPAWLIKMCESISLYM